MKTTAELEKELQAAKDLEYSQYRQRDLDELNKSSLGKCYGSHTFERANASQHMGAVYYESFFFKEKDIWVRQWSISVSKYPSIYKTNKNSINYNRFIYEKQLTGTNDYNASYNLFNGYNYYRKEISFDKFMQLWNASEDASLMIKDSFTSIAPELKMELIRQGDSTDEDRLEKGIEEIGLDIIDFKKFPKVLNVLEYRTLPMFQERRWLPRIYAKQILEYQIKLLEKDNQGMFATERVINHNNWCIEIIREFINKELIK